MPVLGLVLVLEDGGEATRGAVGRWMDAQRDLALGAVQEHRWPAVLEASTSAEAEDRVKELRAAPGVACIDVVYADFEDLLDPTEGSAAGLQREED